jgi:hypothetical protein
VNCIFSGNLANDDGGAIINFAFDGVCQARYINCVFTGNLAEEGGVALNDGAGGGFCSPVFVNSILWNNDASLSGPVFNNQIATPILSFSIIQGMNDVNDPSITSGNLTTQDGGNNKPLGTDPEFLTEIFASEAPTDRGDFHVSNFSNAINMGDNTANASLTDLDDLERVQSGTIDIGAYEYQVNCGLYLTRVVYVDSSATGSNNGVDWQNAFSTLKDALNVVHHCGNIDTVKIAKGTYYPSCPDTLYDKCGNVILITPASQAASFRLDSLVVLGGYPTGGSPDSLRDWDCNKVILSGDIQQDGDITNNSYNVIRTFYNSADPGKFIVVDGVCITGGYAFFHGTNGFGTIYEGGGWYNTAPYVIVKNSQIYNNEANAHGGGVYSRGFDQSSFMVFVNTIIKGNKANFGGGLHFYGYNAGNGNGFGFENSIISGNFGTVDGGGMYINIGVNTLVKNGVYNTIFAGNATGPGQCSGGAIYGVSTDPGSSIISTIINSIFWNNVSDNGADIFHGSGDSTIISFSIFGNSFASLSAGCIGCVQDMGGNKFSTDPLFVN